MTFPTTDTGSLSQQSLEFHGSSHGRRGGDAIPDLLIDLWPFKKTDQALATTSTVLQNDNDLTFPAAAQEWWAIDAFILIGVAGAASGVGVDLALSAPTGAAITGTALFTDGANGSLTVAASAAASDAVFGGGFTDSTASGIATIFSTAPAIAVIHATLRMGDGNNGPVYLQACQNVSSATVVTLQKGSWLHAHRLQPE